MDPLCMHWDLIVKTWIKTFPKFIPEAIKEKLADMFNRFCIPLFKVGPMLFLLSYRSSFLKVVLRLVYRCCGHGFDSQASSKIDFPAKAVAYPMMCCAN